MLDGLWAGDSDMMRDLGIATRRIKALGFNTVRLPFSFKVSFLLKGLAFRKLAVHVLRVMYTSLLWLLTPPRVNKISSKRTFW
jgi:hypothetical protein